MVVFIASSDYKSLLQCHGTRFHYSNEDKRTYSQWAPDLLHAAKSGTDSHSGGQIPGAHLLDSQGCSTLTSVYLFLIHVVGRERRREEVLCTIKSSPADSCEEPSGLTRLGVYGREWHVPAPGSLYCIRPSVLGI